jgi:hypothetical protein
LKKGKGLERMGKGAGWAVPWRCNRVFEWPYCCPQVTRILHTKRKERWVGHGPILCHCNIPLHFSTTVSYWCTSMTYWAVFPTSLRPSVPSVLSSLAHLFCRMPLRWLIVCFFVPGLNNYNISSECGAS